MIPASDDFINGRVEDVLPPVYSWDINTEYYRHEWHGEGWEYEEWNLELRQAHLNEYTKQLE